MGAYTRAGVDHYIGSYLTLRPSFSIPGSIMAYRTDITWDDEWPSLLRPPGRRFGELGSALRETLGLIAYRVLGRTDALWPGPP